MKKNIIKILSLLLLILFSNVLSFHMNNAFAMPFYQLCPQSLCVRSKFYTTYYSSSKERIANIKLASSFINGTLLDIGEEFSFNSVVGERSEKNGFKVAKIIVNGKFVDGVGGGVCQVSTTLYNAVLLSDLKITEYHPHSLPVSYISPSFDAMVNSYTANLRFINNTDNPIIIYSNATDSKITFTILGQKNQYEIERESIIKEQIPVNNEIIFDDKNEFLDLYENEQRVIQYGKPGFISEGYLIYKSKGKTIKKVKIRENKYNSTNNIIMQGKQQKIEQQ